MNPDRHSHGWAPPPGRVALNIIDVPVDDAALQGREVVHAEITNLVSTMELGLRNIDLNEMRRRMQPHFAVEYTPSVFQGIVVRFCGFYMPFNARIFSTGFCVLTGTKSPLIALAVSWQLVAHLQRLGYPTTLRNFAVINMTASTAIPGHTVDVARVPEEDGRFNYAPRRFPAATMQRQKRARDETPEDRISSSIYPSAKIVLAGARHPDQFVPVAQRVIRLGLRCSGRTARPGERAGPSRESMRLQHSLDRMGARHAPASVAPLAASADAAPAGALVPYAAGAAALVDAAALEDELSRRIASAYS